MAAHERETGAIQPASLLNQQPALEIRCISRNRVKFISRYSVWLPLRGKILIGTRREMFSN